MIDFRHAESLSETILDNIFKSEKAHVRSINADTDGLRQALFGEAIERLWDRLLSDLGAFENGKPLTQSEKAIACIARRLGGLKSITLHCTDADIPLENLTYNIRKEGQGFRCDPQVLSLSFRHGPMRWISLSGEDFADFLFEFDSLISAVAQKVDSRLVNEMAIAMQLSIISETVRELGEVYLTPKGIFWDIDSDITDNSVTVTFHRKGVESLSETIGLGSLAEVIAGIPARMDRQPKNAFPTLYDDLEAVLGAVPDGYFITHHRSR